MQERGLKVEWILETHAHADHLSAAPWLQAAVGGQGHRLLARPAAEDDHAVGLAVVLGAFGAGQPAEEIWRRGFGEIASLAQRLLREVDCSAALSRDLIAIASHGRRGISRLLLGSQTSKVLAHSGIPVLVCR